MPACKQELNAIAICPALTVSQNGFSNGNHATKDANLKGDIHMSNGAANLKGDIRMTNGAANLNGGSHITKDAANLNGDSHMNNGAANLNGDSHMSNGAAILDGDSHMTNGAANQNGDIAGKPPFKVCQDGVLGRHLVATRDIRAGEVILQEAPIVTGPPLDFQPCCVACYKALTLASHRTCPKGCGWPVCSDRCAEAPAHQPECNVTRNVRKDKVSIEDWNGPCPLFESLIVLRCLTYRDSNPALWTKMSGLEAHTAKRRGTPKWEREKVSIALFLIQYFKLVCTEDEILRICGIIQVNGYGVRLTEPSYIAVYDQLSFIEHHCIPNCSKSWSAAGTLTVRAVNFIPNGHHLSICYTNPLWGTVSRRSHLVQELLLCCCSRCADPTECGTYYSALTCTRNSCDGYLLPEDPIPDVSETSLCQHVGNSSWRCNKCDTTWSSEQVDSIMQEFKKKLTQLNKMDAGSCEELLQEGLKLFHENHFYLTEVRTLLAVLIGQGTSGMTGLAEKQLQLKITLCRQVLALANTLFLGVPRVTGTIRFELQRALMESARRERSQSGESHQQVTKQLLEAQQLLTEAVSILSFEPEVLPEGQVFIEAKKELEKLSKSTVL